MCLDMGNLLLNFGIVGILGMLKIRYSSFKGDLNEFHILNSECLVINEYFFLFCFVFWKMLKSGKFEEHMNG